MAIRIDTANKSDDLFGTGKDGFKDQAALGTSPTRLNAAWFNHAQEEVNNVVEAVGIDVAGGSTYNQMLGALQFADIQRAFFPGVPSVTPGTDNLYTIVGGGHSVGGAGAGTYRALAAGASGSIYRLGVPSVAGWEQDTADAAYSGTFNASAYTSGRGHFLAGTGEEIQANFGLGTGVWNSKHSGSDTLYTMVGMNSPDVILAAGSNAKVLSSIGGAAFTARTSTLTGTIYDSAWSESEGLIILAGEGGIETSPDGITFTNRQSGDFYAVDWIESVGIGVAMKKTTGDIYYTTDAITWTDSGVDISDMGFSRIVGCGGGLVIMGSFNVACNMNDWTPSGMNRHMIGSTEPLTQSLRDFAYDPIARLIWMCGDGGLIYASPAPFGV